jgi:hypothetical protein
VTAGRVPGRGNDLDASQIRMRVVSLVHRLWISQDNTAGPHAENDGVNPCPLLEDQDQQQDD